MVDDLTDPHAVSALRSIAHPVRIRILSLLTAEAMSAAEVARTLDLTHANASYHLRVLHDAGELVVESEEKIRGGVAKRYRYVVEDKPSHTPATLDDRVAYVHAIAHEVTRRLSESGGGPRTFSDLETWVTPEHWAKAVELFARASALLHDHAQRPGSQGTLHVSASYFAFPLSDPQQDDR